MKLAEKIFLLITIILITIITVQYFPLRYLILQGFTKIEQIDTKKNITRIHKAFQEQIKSIEVSVSDWSRWDDTYNFVNKKNELYITSNLSDSSIINLKMNLFVIINNQQNIIFGRKIENDWGSPLTIEEKKTIESDYQLTNFQNNLQHHNGIISVNNKYYIISAQPILKSNGEGPINGTFIMGRLIDDIFINSLSAITDLNINLHKFKWDSKDKNKIVSYILKNNFFIDLNDKKTIRYYLLFKDLHKFPSFYISVNIFRNIFLEAESTITSFTLSIIISGIITIFFIYIILNKFIIHPILLINKKIETIKNTEDFSLRFIIQGHDEINDLKNEINNFLIKLNQSQESNKRLLDNTVQGFFVIDKNGVIQPQFSKPVTTMFKKDPSGLHISILFQQKKEIWDKNIESIFLKDTSFKVNSNTLPNHIVINNSFIELEYKDIRNQDKKITHMMVIATDITEIKDLQKRKDNNRKINLILIKIVTNKDEFIQIYNEIKNINTNDNDKEYYLNFIQKTKGLLSFFGLEYLSEICHQYYEIIKKDPSPETIEKIQFQLIEKLDEFINKNDHILAIKTPLASFEFYNKTIHQLIDFAHQEKMSDFIIDKLEEIVKLPINKALYLIELNYIETAKKLGKKINPIIWTPSDLIDPYYYDKLFQLLPRIAQNSAIYGLESPENRLKNNKVEEGTLTVGLILRENVYYLTINDDGPGIDLNIDNQKLIDILCIPSTPMKSLALIRQELKALGGDLSVRTKKGEGTTFVLWFNRYIYRN